MIKMFNEYFSKINAYSKEIGILKEEILFLQNVVSDKESIAKISSSRVLEELKRKEKEVENLIGNKKYKHIKFADFLSSNELHESKQMEVFENGGFVICSPETKVEQVEVSRKFSRDKKEFYIEYSDPIYTNEIEFSFVDENQVPITPKEIIFINETEEELNEHDFRYYNRNESYDFSSRFFYYPRVVRSIKVIFDVPVNSKNAKLKLFQNSFSDAGEANFKLRFELAKQIDNANIYINSEESVVPLDISFSTDDISYEKIASLKKNEANLDFAKTEELFIKIKPNYTDIVFNEYKEKVTKIERSEVIKHDKVIYELPLKGEVQIKKIFLSSKNFENFKDRAEYDKINIEKYLDVKDGKTCLNTEFLFFIKKPSTEQDLLYSLDSIKDMSLEENFNFYFDTTTNTFYFPAFMDEYDFFIEYEVEEVISHIDSKFFTPKIFDIAIKY